MIVQSNRVPSLDGLRAISIVLVLIHHLAGTEYSFVPASFANALGLGELGVRVFFVISGFLITNLLLQELETGGTINLPRFYFRRTFRIFPPYYALILVLIFLQSAGLIVLNDGDVLHALTYTSNYNPGRSWYLGHTWSLAVEEQFYLLWPAALLITGKRRGLYGAALLIVLCPLIRLGMWQFLPQTQSGIGARFETVADAIAIGCILAGTRHWLKSQSLYNRLLASRLFILIPMAVLFANALHERPRIYFSVGYTVTIIGTALCIDWCVTYDAGRIGRFLNCAPMVFVGVMSYSIYLWQQIFLNRGSASAASQFPLNVILVILLSIASYYLIERPSLKLRQRLDRKIFGGKRPAVELAPRQFEPTPGITSLITESEQIAVPGKVATAGAGDQGVP